MRTALSELEKLDTRFPGLLVKVRTWFGLGIKATEIAELLQNEYGVTVKVCVIDYYRLTRWAPLREKHALKLETARVVAEAFGGDDGFDTVVSAKLWELMDKMTIPQLLSARSLFLRIKAQNLKEQEFLFKTGQWKPAPAPGQEVDREAQSRNALRRIKEIFGLAGEEPPKPPVRQLPAAAGNESQ